MGYNHFNFQNKIRRLQVLRLTITSNWYNQSHIQEHVKLRYKSAKITLFSGEEIPIEVKRQKKLGKYHVQPESDDDEKRKKGCDW